MNGAKHSLGILGDVMYGIKDNAMDYLKIGLGGTLAVMVAEFLQSRVLVRNGSPLIPLSFAPLATAAFGVIAGELVKQRVDRTFGEAMAYGGIIMGTSAYVARFVNPAVNATAASAAAAESSGAGAQQMAGVGFGRLFAGGAPALGAGASLYGVGTPDMRAAGMFGGATVAIEDTTGGGGLSGATVAIEEAGGFAGALN